MVRHFALIIEAGNKRNCYWTLCEKQNLKTISHAFHHHQRKNKCQTYACYRDWGLERALTATAARARVGPSRVVAVAAVSHSSETRSAVADGVAGRTCLSGWHLAAAQPAEVSTSSPRAGAAASCC